MSDRKRSAARGVRRLLSGRSSTSRHSHSKTAKLRLECLEPRLALSGLSLSFAIQNPHYNAANVYVTFVHGSLNATYDGGKAVLINHSYSLSELNGPVSLTSYTGGRIFVSLGGGVAGANDPEMVNPQIPSYSVRHDKIEITYSASDENSCANLTAVDFSGIPLEINTSQGGTQVGQLSYRLAYDKLLANLGALIGNNREIVLNNGSQFLRLLSPHTTPLSQAMRYSSMAPYIEAVKVWQRTHQGTLIEGLYSKNGSTPATQTQNYHFVATIQPDGSLKMVGGGSRVGGGGWPGKTHTIVVSAANLLKGIYLGNVPWTVDGVRETFDNNDVYAAAVRDVLAGFNLGFIASQTIDPATHKAFGAESSKFWWNSTRAFDYLQSNPAYYNRYAQIVTSNSDAYSWAFSDRWSHVQAALSKVDTMQIVVLPDSASTALPGLYNPSTDTFYLRNANTTGRASASFQSNIVGAALTPIAGDWDGDGVETVGLYDSATGMFYLKDSNSGGGSTVSFCFRPTSANMAPIAGDWDRDGIDEIGLYDKQSSVFYLRNTNTAGPADTVFQFGRANASWKPIVGDWDGDRIDEIGLYNTATSQFVLRNTNTPGRANTVFRDSMSGKNLIPIAGDWNRDGRDEFGLYDRAAATFTQIIYAHGRASFHTFRLTSAMKGCLPISGAWLGYPLSAANGTASTRAERITESGLQPIVNEAIARLQAAGLNDASLARLRQVEFVIGDLSGSVLGQAGANVIYIDHNAAGRGWFVDATPATDEEFAATSNGLLRAIDPRAVDRIDLLSVVEHELGHIVGLKDMPLLGNLMEAALGVGIRRSTASA